MIVGLVGFAGSGKDTAGDMLFTQGFLRESFAKPLKDAVSTIFGWNRGMLEGANKVDRAWREQPDEYWSKKFGYEFSPRLALQLMGTEAGRDVFHQNIWLDALERRIQEKPEKDFVVTDTRFNNEIQRLREMNAIIIRVKRGPEPAYYEAALEYNSPNNIHSVLPYPLHHVHRSEWDWIGNPSIQYVVENEGTLLDLELQINKIVDDHFGDTV